MDNSFGTSAASDFGYSGGGDVGGSYSQSSNGNNYSSGNSSYSQPAQQPPAPQSGGMLGQQPQSQPQPQSTWRDQFLPEHLRNEPFFSRFDSPEKFAESALNAHRFVGRKLSDIPVDKLREMFSPEEIAQYHQARGIPENPDGYEISGLPEEITKIPQVQKAITDFKGLAHKLGMSPDVAQELVKFEYQLHQNAMEEAKQQNFASLSQTYGRNLEGADRVATEAVRALGGQELVDYMKQTGLAMNPKIFGAFVKLGQMMQNDRVPLANTTSGGGDSAIQIKTEIQRLYNDPQFYRQYRENNPQAHERINALYKRLQQFESGR